MIDYLGPDAFESDLSTVAAFHRPLVKVATSIFTSGKFLTSTKQISVQVMALINSLCVMLQTTPFHRENHSRLILTVIGQFYQRCSDRFTDLVASQGATSPTQDGNGITIAAQWAQSADISTCLSELLRLIKADGPTARRHQLCRQETHLEQNMLGDRILRKEGLIKSIRNLSALSSLYCSVVSTSTDT